MYSLLILISTLIAIHSGLFLVGLIQLQALSRQLPAAIAAGFMVASMVVVIMFGSWSLLVLSFVLYHSWTMLEGLLLHGRISHASMALAPINLISIGGSLVAFFSGNWMIFAGVYLFHWSTTLFVGRKLMGRFSRNHF